ncbi:NADPH:quinone oxidoreductase family protein [uncultured Microbacterium sp.]|uniref:NADPH:quinone oxidoreductase family protein n=1 Tax=uncultured Microbacterium sp. TaxID=191216 RepID=UPI0035CB4960
MKAQICRELSDPPVLHFEEIDDLRPGAREVLIQSHAAGVNFPDGLVLAGTYQTKPALPFIPGSEVAGVVEAVGDGVSNVAPGDRVAAFSTLGGYATHAVVAANMVFPIAASMPFSDAAGFVVTYGTSCHALVDRAQLANGETLLVLGASGGVGLAAVEIGAALGANVIAAASTPEKRELCLAHGASLAIDYSQGDLRDTLKRVAPGGIDVVYDPVGGAAALTAARSLAWGGRYLSVGYASGDIPEVGMNRFLIVSATLHGVLWGAWARKNPAANARNFARLFEWYEQGALRPHTSATFPLEDAVAALEVVMGRLALGKVVLDVR